jgi:NADPH2:quinone reductase
MTDLVGLKGLELRSTITSSGTLALRLEEVVVPEPAWDEVLVRVEAAPLNPSDIILLLGPAELSTIQAVGSADRPMVKASVPQPRLAEVMGRLDQAVPAGNEGAGIIIDAGTRSRELIGRTVATRSNLGMYAQYRIVKASDCMLLPEGTPPRQGASAFINPLTALGMVETMRREGHTALVHTAAASNLGQMLNRVCLADHIGLVNIVRSKQQMEILHSLGAKYVLDSTSLTFKTDLTDALTETGATLAFDAIGGGAMASTILEGMEQAAIRNAKGYSRYGSSTHKQVYIYGVLDAGPTQIDRNFGMAWGVGGWLMTWFIEKIGPKEAERLKNRVAAELTTTFVSSYTAEISLTEALSPDIIARYARRATGAKYLIVPHGRGGLDMGRAHSGARSNAIAAFGNHAETFTDL